MITGRRAVTIPIGLILPWLAQASGGCSALLPALQPDGRESAAAAATVQAALREYHRDIARHLDRTESSGISQFVADLGRDIEDPATMAAHVARFTAGLKDLTRDRLDEEHRFRKALAGVGSMRAAAQSTGLSSLLRRTVESLLDHMLPEPEPVPDEPET